MPLPFLDAARRPAVIAMLHVPALPGTARSVLSVPELIDHVLAEAAVYQAHGVDALLLENMHDVPYLKADVGHEVTACLTAVACAVARAAAVPVGVQVLAGANQAALAVAVGASLAFVRVEGFVFGHVADEGWLDACAGPLLRERRRLGADHVAVLADIKKKHAAHAPTADVSLAETAAAAAFAGADGVIVTGVSTGAATAPDDLVAVRGATDLPVLVGSGVTAANVHRYADADAVIVGSDLKAGGHWAQPVEAARVAAFMARARALRSG
ncbi:MAG: BtpA/SgcQ family protein [Candidatus Krumholzibacteriia bacterium]